MEKALTQLIQLGFSAYEGRAYLTLVHENPLTAYELAKSSGIPTSKIYEVIRKLEKRQIIQSVHGERSKTFVPLPPDEFIAGIRAFMDEASEAIKKEMAEVKAGMDRGYTWHIRDYEGLLHKASRMIDTAKRTLLLSAWPQELAFLSESLNHARERGVKTALVHYGVPDIIIHQLYVHPIEDTLYAERDARGFTLVADSREALNGTIMRTKTEAIWSMNEGYVIMAEGYIRHDIYQMKTVMRLAPLLKKIFGERYEKMRDVFTDDDLSMH
ncbi:MAG: TrmB family transcriptional regulator [Nitrospiraceae bacterium]|nr:MAG: TrmB family transcriptional regulator [Nitrospiraceae bacterium]